MLLPVTAFVKLRWFQRFNSDCSEANFEVWIFCNNLDWNISDHNKNLGKKTNFCLKRVGISYLTVCKFGKRITAWKVSKHWVFSGPYFPVFGLNAAGLNLRIQFKYRKIRTRENSVFGHFSRSEQTKKVKSISLYFIHFSLKNCKIFSLKSIQIWGRTKRPPIAIFPL